MRNIEVCSKCKHFHCHQTARPVKNGGMEAYKKYYCQIDDKGLEKTKNSITFKECDVLFDEFVILDCPKNCPYKLEHIVIKRG